MVGLIQTLGGGTQLFTPAFQPCVCGKRWRRESESGALWFSPCCEVTYLQGGDGRRGPVWLDVPPALRRRTAPRVVTDLSEIPDAPPGMTTALYRRFDGGGTLLYLGITDFLQLRCKHHDRYSVWAPLAARMTVEWFATRTEAEAAEVAAIRNEHPVFNLQHAGPEAEGRRAAYLLQMKRNGLARTSAEQTQK